MDEKEGVASSLYNLLMEDLVAKLKEEGNKLFKEGNFIKAHEKYSEALKHDPGNSIIYSNRSLTSTKLKNFDFALSDALECIRLNSQWSKGYLRKAVALYGLGRHDEVLKSAAEGFKVSGEGPIKRELVSLWFKAAEIQNHLPEGSMELPAGIVILSQDYLLVLVHLMRSLSGECPLSLPLMEQCLYNCAEQVETLLRVFGEPVSPIIKEWVKRLSCEVYPHSNDPVAMTKLEQDMKSSSEVFVSFLNKDIDPALHPVLRPILGLIVLVVLNRTNILTECNTGHHAAELMNQALLPLFETSILSTDVYHTMYIGRLCAVLDSFIGRGYRLGDEETSRVRKYSKKLHDAISNYPKHLPEYQKDKSLAERSLSNVHHNILLPASVTPPKVPVTSLMSVEVAEQIVKEKPQEAKSYIEKHLRELEIARFLSMGEVVTMTG